MNKCKKNTELKLVDEQYFLTNFFIIYICNNRLQNKKEDLAAINMNRYNKKLYSQYSKPLYTV
jgi:hypothetical protein